MELNYKKVLIYGYSVSGKAVEKALNLHKINYFIYDDNSKLQGGRYLKKLSKKDLSSFDLIVISPGVSIYNKNIVLAEKLGIKVVSELEFGSWFASAKIIAITGTNGKTTTTSLISHVLKKLGYKVECFGNIGHPLSNIVDYKDLDYAVVEVSSFQLEAIYKFSPYIAILLNIDEDHIDRHKTFENYIKCKLNIFRNSSIDTYSIINADDAIINKYIKNVNGKIFSFSERHAVRGVYLTSNLIYSSVKNSEEVEIGHVKDFENCNTFMSNILAVLCVAEILNLKYKNVVSAISEFEWLPNRIQVVAEFNGVKYINDSKATNIHATYYAVLKQKSNITLLLGGKDKNLNFINFFKVLPNNVKRVVLFGQARNVIKRAINKTIKIENYSAKTLKNAIEIAMQITPSGEDVMLSPACASFDEFNDYKQRGKYFEHVVKDLILKYENDKNNSNFDLVNLSQISELKNKKNIEKYNSIFIKKQFQKNGKKITILKQIEDPYFELKKGGNLNKSSSTMQTKKMANNSQITNKYNFDLESDKNERDF